MSRDYPDWIHPIKAAQARREFAGSMALSRMERIRDLVPNPGEAEIAFSIRFSLDEHRQVRVEVSVSGSVPLVCQRTLQAYQQPVESCSVVGIVSDERQAEALPADYEPLWLEEEQVRIEDLVAEELLLSLPLVPRAPESRPMADERPAAADTYKPFAELAELANKADADPFKQE
jgi:uncharacterized protein